MESRRFLGALCLLLLPTGALAQDQTHWAVVGSVTPQWKVPSQLEELFDGTVDLKGTDFAIGIARGRHRSGDWGVGTSTLPLLKIQLAVGFIVNPSFKIRAQGGLDLPGYEIFSITGVVFLGAR